MITIKDALNELNEQEKEQFERFLLNLQPRDGQPQHSDLWSQIYDYCRDNEHEGLRKNVSNILDLFNKGIKTIEGLYGGR